MKQYNREFLNAVLSVCDQELIVEDLLIDHNRSWSNKKVYKYGILNINCYRTFFLVDHPLYEQQFVFQNDNNTFSLLGSNMNLQIPDFNKINDKFDFFNYTVLYPDSIFTLNDISNIKKIDTFIKEVVYDKWD